MKTTSQIKICLALLCILLQGCSERFRATELFKAGTPGQVFSKSFSVYTTAGYGIFLIFNWDENSTHHDEQQLVISGQYFLGPKQTKGVLIPLHVRVLKDKKIYFEGNIDTYGADGSMSFCYDTKKNNRVSVSYWQYLIKDSSNVVGCEDWPNVQIKNGLFRIVETFNFPPGKYSVEVRSLKKINAIENMEIFINILPYDPKV